MLAEYPDTGCCIAGRTGRENRIERLVQGIGGSGLADPAGPEHASAAGAVPGGVLVGRGPLELPEWLFLPAVLLWLAAGAQNFWVFCKERLDRSKKEKNHRVGFNSHQ